MSGPYDERMGAQPLTSRCQHCYATIWLDKKVWRTIGPAKVTQCDPRDGRILHKQMPDIKVP